MKRMSLLEANSFLHDPVRYRDYLVRTVASSTAITESPASCSTHAGSTRFITSF